MKKRIYSILSMFLIAITCVLASACGNKYGKMEFQVLYAFSTDAKTWHDGTDGIFITYGENDELVEGEEQSSLIFNENDQASLFIKVKIKNVKAKHLGSIAMSFSSVSGLEFSSKMISTNKAIEVPISKDVKISTQLKLHESNSGKNFSTSFNVSRRLESLSANLDVNPAMFSTSTLNLTNLTNDVIVYNPSKTDTNETGVNYSLGRIGHVTATGFSADCNAEQAVNFVELTDNVLKIKDDSFINTSNVIEIIATSIYHDGVENEEDLIQTSFYVYVVKPFMVDEQLLTPTVKFENNEGTTVDAIHIYENGGKYSTSTIFTNTQEDVGSVSISTYNGTNMVVSSVTEAIYVKNSNGYYVKYNFTGENQQEGVNGLSVFNSLTDSQLTDQQYKFAIFDRNINQNTIKIAYEFDGLNFSYGENVPKFEKEIVVNKLAVPKFITINNTTDLANGEQAEGVIYVTSSSSYGGLDLTINANPTTNSDQTIKIKSTQNLIITGAEDKGDLNYSIKSGQKIQIKLKDKSSGDASLTLTTSTAPYTNYNGKIVNDDSEIEVVYNIKKVVTANKLSFGEYKDNKFTEFEKNEESLVRAQGGGYLYVKATHLGQEMDGNSVKLYSANDSILFANGTCETTLNTGYVTGGVEASEDSSYYSIYKIQIKSPGVACEGNVNVVAGDGQILVSDNVLVKAVNVAGENTIIKISASNAISVSHSDLENCFMLKNLSSSDFKLDLIQGSMIQSGAIKDEKIKVVNRESQFNFTYLGDVTPLSNTTFVVSAQNTGTEILKATIQQYCWNDDNSLVEVVERSVYIQIAVFNPITNISVVATKENISYVSPYYEEAGKTTIKFAAKTFQGQTITDKVEFYQTPEIPGNDLITVRKLAGIKTGIVEQNNSSLMSYVDGIGALNDKTYDCDDSLSEFTKEFELTLSGEINTSKLTIKFTALMKGVESSVNSTITINIKQPNKATGIQINGKALNFNAKDKVDDAELEMSFIKVEDGGFAEAEFDAKILFSNSNDGIKFDNIATDLTYFINRYTLTENNSIDVNNKIDEHDDFFVVTLANGKVNIKAAKQNGGGIFQLVLATKDSFVGDDKESATYDEFDTVIAITIRVLDGDQVAFAIKTEEDFADVNKNLRSRFALYNDVEITKDMDPLGYRDGQLSAFEGVLTGRPDGYGEDIQYQITQTINKMVTSDTYGNVAGLFGVVGVNGKVENLKYVLHFKDVDTSNYNFVPTSIQGFNLGAIAGVNLGKLNNVAVTMKSDVSLKANTSIEINVGGLVGLNENTIANCSIKNDYPITISAENVSMNVGLIAGTNKGEIAGRYKSKSDLNNYVFDVVSNLIVNNAGSGLNVGGVAGSNTGEISNLLVGGKIASNKGNLGGFAGTSSGKDNTISTVVALSLDVACKDGTANKGTVGGIVGSADATEIDYVKYLSAKTYFNKEQTSTDGQVVGEIAGGIVGESSDEISLTECSVESFVNGLNAVSGSTVGGLVASGEAVVSNSFVKANLKATGSDSVYTSAGSLTDVYFIGDVTGEFADNSYGTYKFDLTTIDISDYMTPVDFDDITDWSNAYFLGDGEGQYVKVSEEDDEQEGGAYYQLNVDEWTEYAKKELVSPDWTTNQSYEDWEIQKYYNAVKINGVEVFLPYLLRTLEDSKKEPLMIVEPREIVATVNVDYVTKHNSDVVEDYEDNTTIPNYTITESIIVNYFNQAGDEANSYNLISDEGEDNGLLDVTLFPYDAQGLYSFKIIEGYEFAYINNAKQLVVTSVSGNQRILIEIYSGFNPDCKTYVAVYSQNLLTELKLTSNNVERLDKEVYKADIFVGQDDLILSIDAVNNFNDIDYGSIFNVDSISDYLVLSVVKKSDSVLNCEAGAVDFSNVKLSFNNTPENVNKIVNNYNEILTIKLCLKAEYFKKGETYFVSKNSLIPVGEVSLKVYVHNSAEGIIVNGDDTEISSKDGMSFEVFLSTETIDIEDDKELPFDPSIKVNSDGIIEIEEKDLNGNDVNTTTQIKRDSIKIEFEYGDDSQAEIDRILAEVNKSKFADLFEITINRSFYLNQNDEILGYYYYVELMLKDEHKYRSLNSAIRFNIKVSALTNPEVNNGDGLSVTIKPTTLTTIKMSSYVVENISYRTDYSELVANNNKEVSIIEPGGSGNIMIINIEPSYAKVGSVLIKSSQINVPKLGSVGINFTQLVFDETLNRYTTLYGANAPEQTDEGLKLNRISTIGEDFTGVIYVLMQLPRMEGVVADIDVTLEVETSDGVKVEHTKTLATTNLPGIEVSFDEQYKISDETNGYYVQTGSENNEIEIKVIGYTFSKTPEIKVSWDDAAKKINGSELSTNKQVLTINDVNYYAIDYVSLPKLNDITNAVHDPTNNSYTLKQKVGIKKLLMAPIKISVYLEVTTKDGEIVTSEDGSNDNYVVLWPTDYLLSSYGVKNLSNGRKNVAISSTSILELSFNTKDSENDYSDAIFSKLIDYAKTGNVIDESKIAEMFTFYNEEKGANDSFDSFLNVQGTEAEKTKAFEFNVAMHEINGNATPVLEITGLGQLNKRITLSIPYYYKSENGSYKLTFGDSKSHNPFEFELNIYAVTSENEIPIYTADEIYDSKTGKWDLVEGAYYVLMADIELENVVPITTKIGQLDGNNRTISIKSFKIDDQATEYGLFANIGTYEVTDQETETKVETPTILKNVIVDYSKFGASSSGKLPDVATIPLANSTAEKLTIGGLVGTNNGGLIYNCDVVNLSNSLTKRIDVIVPTNAEVKFGGLVGENSGVITNSRVGRDSYERVTIANGINSQRTVYMGGLSFSVYHSQNDEGNQFKNEVAGFVATNSGTISNSFVTRTNLTNYSTNESLNRTAGFVATNSGTILSSYVKSDESKINKDAPRSTGYVIEQKGNGILAGFVYANSGTISNAYSNVELQTKSAYIAGFVYNNMTNGKISETYAASTMNSASGDNNAEQPFVGVSNAGKLLSDGTIKNSYYLMRNEFDNPYMQDEKDFAYALNVKNFQVADNLTNFAFVLSESIEERRQGVWSYYTLTNKNVVLPELMSANNIAYSYRYESEAYNAETGEKETILKSSSRCELGSAVNPYAISSPEEFNKYLKINEKENSSGGHHFRLINNIDFSEPRFGGQAVSVATKTDFSLGSNDSTTSFEGNGLSIKNIYLDINNTQSGTVESVGLFAEINNAYVKNINLSFATNKEFSTKSAIYSGGLAGKIHNSAIMNIKITGSNTFVGRNFVGGLAGLIDGKSLIYGIEASVNVKAESKGQELYYNRSAYEKLGRISATGLTYDQFIESDKLSYAGAIAGVLDIEKRPGVEFNVHSVTVRGDLITEKVDANSKKEPNISGQFAGGIAGYAGSQTNALRLNFIMNKDEAIYGEYAAGGLFGVSLGRMVASQVSAKEEIQYDYDTEIGEYIIDTEIDKNAVLDETKIGNVTLLESENYVGGLVGIGLGTIIYSDYSKATVKDGAIVGGLIGLNIASDATYSYAVPYINSSNKLKKAGGLFGLVCAVSENPQAGETDRFGKLQEYSKLIAKVKGVRNGSTSNIQFTYSSLIIDETFENTGACLDYVVADYILGSYKYVTTSNSTALKYVYFGKYKNNGTIIQSQTKEFSNSILIEAYELYNLKESTQELTFNEVFSGWESEKYWSLDSSKYLPLLTTKVVDNFIIIDDEKDFDLIAANPSLNYKIIKDIDVSIKSANWVINCGEKGFSGILLGELETDSSSRPKVRIQGLKPSGENLTSGFINKCCGATISNIEIVWVNQDNQESSIVTDINLDYVSGFVCEDDTDGEKAGSLITNVVVRAEKYNNDDVNEGSIFCNAAKSIQGFGGIVGKGNGTTILGCEFISPITAKISNIVRPGENPALGGIAGRIVSSGNGNTDSSKLQGTALISGSNIGASKNAISGITYPITQFNITVENCSADIGGVIGHSNNVAISTISVGSLEAVTTNNTEYKSIKMNVNINNTGSEEKDVNIGGVGGYIKDGVVTGVTDLADIVIEGSSTTTSANVGGFAGYYSLSGQNLTNGIRKSEVQATIKRGSVLELASLRVSTGFGTLASNSKVEQCLFDGEVNTNQSAEESTDSNEVVNIPTVYAGAVAAYVDSGADATLEQIMTNVALYAGHSTTESLYVGGLIGGYDQGKITIESCSTWGRVIPVTSDKSSDVYAGGFVGLANQIKIANSYSLSSVILSSLADKSIAELTAGALVGEIEKCEASEVTNVYYSTDIALCVDENYINKNPIGTNLSAETIWSTQDTLWVTNLKGEGEVWVQFDEKNKTIPHLSALEDSLKAFGIYGQSGYDQGSVMNPKVITSSNTAFDEEFKYYRISSTLKQLPILNGTLNGILIGSDLGDEVGYGATQFNFVQLISAHSAVSNVHIQLGSNKKYQKNNPDDLEADGFIAGVNNGVIFNCSVQGNLVQISSTDDDLGLIVGQNKGLVSHCYSSAEITETAKEVAGIAYYNVGKMLSNYFTGYINSTAGGAGMYITTESDDAGYLYNNYMGGVITVKRDETKVFAVYPTTDLAGSRNFIDKYSDINLWNSQYKDSADINGTIQQFINRSEPLISVQTAQLMANAYKTSEGETVEKHQLLAGEWHTVLDADEGTFKESASTFGRNYNYPVYKFNKMASTSLTNAKNIDYQKQLKTGTGLKEFITMSADGKTTLELATGGGHNQASLVQRYQYLTERRSVTTKDGTIYESTDTYNNAYKIPHYGILQSVQALLNANRNYVLLYDIDATITTSGEESGLGSKWKALGSDSNIDGFTKGKATGFNGVFVTNRYLTQSDGDNQVCTIQGVSEQGLFANVNDAFIGNINLGSFYKLNNSGAIAVNIGNEGNNANNIATVNGSSSTNDDTVHVYLELISFSEQSEISGTGDASNYYAALIGSVNGLVVNINNFDTTSNGVTSKLTLKGDDDTVGLVAGKVNNGKIVFANPLKDEPTAQTQQSDENTRKLIALFDGNGVAGGIVGSMDGGSIDMADYQVLISRTGDIEQQDAPVNAVKENSEAVKYTKILGGIVGECRNKIEINGARVTMFASNGKETNAEGEGAEVEIYSNAFGGFIGVAKDPSVINLTGNSVLDMQGHGVRFYFDKNISEEFYYGLLVGNLGGNLTVDSFDLHNKVQDENEEITPAAESGENTVTTNVFNMRVGSTATNIYEDYNDACGLGGFVGKQGGNLTVAKYSAPTVIAISAEGLPNTGGIAGIYTSGNVELDLSMLTSGEGNVTTPLDDSNSQETAQMDYLFVVSGSTNVGGLFGWAQGTLSHDSFKTYVETQEDGGNQGKSVSLLNSGYAYSLVFVHANSSANDKNVHKNYGGLVGKWGNSSNTAAVAHAKAEAGEGINKTTSITNYNDIIIGHGCGKYTYKGSAIEYEGILGQHSEGYASNVGGVVGSLECAAKNLVNNAGISYLDHLVISREKSSNEDTEQEAKTQGDEEVKHENTKIENIESIMNIGNGKNSGSGQNNSSYYVARAVNVGGVAGYATTPELENFVNTASVTGYQNVGGLVGRLEGSKITNSGNFVVADTMKSHSVGEVSGVINVGGAIGLSNKSEVVGIVSTANVFGNASVGGLVGYAIGGSVSGCQVGTVNETGQASTATQAESTEQLIVSGIYYSHRGIGEKVENAKDFIPTSIGGFIGTVQRYIDTSTSNVCNIQSCLLGNVLVTSAKEGGSQSESTPRMTISTNKNHMHNVRIGEGANEIKPDTIDEVIELDNSIEKIGFNDIMSGFGGFIGTTHTSGLYLSNSTMKNVQVEATLGVNVGYVYGSFNVDSSAKEALTNATNEEELSDLNICSGLVISGKASVDGGYNIGGIAGLIISVNEIKGFSIPELTDNLHVQSKLTGINVGGLFGKTLCDKISKLEIPTGTKIVISTDKSYYIGGLIGTAQVNNGKSPELIGLSVPNSGLVANGADNKKNFGAFIGRLKVVGTSSGTTITVNGEHNYAFTINTIENENYRDGTAKIDKAVIERGITELYAEAYYINADTFKISASSQVFTSNPLRAHAKGWSKEYTGFRKIQRCIPASQNNNADWDSTTPFYDAANITHVELKNWNTNNGYTWDQVENGEKNAYSRYKYLYAGDEDNEYTPSPIKFTVYRSFEEEERLYCGMGIAKAQYNTSMDTVTFDEYTKYKAEVVQGWEWTSWNEDSFPGCIDTKIKGNEQIYNRDKNTVDTSKITYKTLSNTQPVWGAYVVGFFTNEFPYSFTYLDYNRPTNSDYNLEKFTWATWKDSKATAKDYYKLYCDGINSTHSIQSTNASKGNQNYTGEHFDVCYFVENYLSGAGLGQEGDAYYCAGNSGTVKTGAYFVFDVIYNNETMPTSFNNNTWTSPSEDSTSPSGSLFDISGLYTTAAVNFKNNTNAFNSWKFWTIFISVAIDVIIIAVTWGTGSAAVAGKVAAKQIGKAVNRQIIKTATKNVIKKIGRKIAIKSLKLAGKFAKKKIGGIIIGSFKKVLITTAVGIVAQQVVIHKSQASALFGQASNLNFGLMGTTYSRDIIYEMKNGKPKLKNSISGVHITDEGEQYVCLSTERPVDFAQANNYITVMKYTHDECDYDKSTKKLKITNKELEGENALKEYLEEEWPSFDPSKHTIEDINLYNEDSGKYEKVEMFKVPVTDGNGQIKYDYYLVQEKYLLVDGKYYLHEYGCDVTLSRTTLQFEPRTYEYTLKGKTIKIATAQPDWIQGENGIYVSGKFDTDYVYDNSYPGNNLKYENKTYSINSKQFDKAIVENNSQDFKYIYDTEFTQNENIDKLGYDYFDKAYYTAEGNNGGWSDNEKKPKQTFYFYGEGKPAGEEDVHYVVEPAVYDQDGKQTQPAYYYTIVKYKNITVPQGVEAEKKFDLYPNRFINPYTDSTYSSVVEDLTFEGKFVCEQTLDRNKAGDEAKTTDAENQQKIIMHNPMYYLYEGGYYVVSDDLSCVDEGGFPPVYVKVTDSELATQLDIDGIGKKTYNDLKTYNKDLNKTNYDLWKGYTIVDSGGVTIGDEFKLEGDILYKYNPSYTIGDDGLLNKYIVSIPTENRKNITLFENMYLSNENFGLYTYYKYGLDFGSKEWASESGSRYLVPQNPKSTTVNGSPTVFIESCRVVFGGNVYTSDSSTKQNYGGISVK